MSTLRANKLSSHRLPISRSLVLDIAGLERKKEDGEEVEDEDMEEDEGDSDLEEVPIDIIVEDELMKFKVSSMLPPCTNAHRPVLQGPHPEQQNRIFSFNFATIRPAVWLATFLPDADPDNAATFQCDVLSDTRDLSDAQIEELAASTASFSKIPGSVLPPEDISQHLYV